MLKPIRSKLPRSTLAALSGFVGQLLGQAHVDWELEGGSVGLYNLEGFHGRKEGGRRSWEGGLFQARSPSVRARLEAPQAGTFRREHWLPK